MHSKTTLNLLLSAFILLFAAASASAGPITNQVVTGYFFPTGYSDNLFDPASGFVPSGAPNVLSPTVTITDTGFEFQYLNGANGVNIDFGPDYLNIEEFPLNGYSGELNSWTMIFTFSNPIIMDVALLSSTFDDLLVTFGADYIEIDYYPASAQNQIPGGRSASIAINQSVPDGGSTLLLMGLTGVFPIASVARRRLRKFINL